MRALGYTEPGSLRVERRYAHGDATRFHALLGELRTTKVDLVFAIGHDIAHAAQQAAPELRVVTAGSEDPVMGGLIRDYQRPGGNITGVTYISTELAAKRLELLKEALPGLSLVAVLWDPSHFDTYYRDMAPVARALGLQLRLFEVRSADAIPGALAQARKAGANALFVVPSRMFGEHAREIARLALEAKLPMMAAYANFTEAGGFISYGAIPADMLKRAAMQSDKILKGARPGEVPFERASTFELVVNLKTASALNVAVPSGMRLRADRVID